MAGQDRVYTLDEARSGGAAPERRRTRRDRAHVLESDPEWLHQGMTMRLKLRGETVDFFAISVLARGVGRSPGTVRRWMEQGLLPEPPYRTPNRYVCAQQRLWTREMVLAMSAAVHELGLQGRRPQRWEGSALPELLRATTATC